MRTMSVRILLALVLVISALSFTTQTVKAIPPIIYEVTLTTDPAIIDDVCDFDITITGLLHERRAIYFDQEGSLEQIIVHTVETDTLTANGKTLHSLPYTYTVHFVINDFGELEHLYVTGIISRVPLPDGSVFLNAGRVDFMDHPDSAFLLSPDYGLTGDIEAFCSALE